MTYLMALTIVSAFIVIKTLLSFLQLAIDLL